MSNTQPASPASSSDTDVASTSSLQGQRLQYFVFGLFFVFGGITSLNDVLIPKLKALFTLSYAEAMLVQSAFFAAYLTMSLPASAILNRLGYMQTAVVGLATMVIGCLLFAPAAEFAEFALFLGALFVVATGITIVQVVANPLVAILGPARTSHSRLTFAQAFNSLGTTVFPYVGAMLILSAASTGEATLGRQAEARIVGHTYLGLAVALLLIATLVWTSRHQLRESQTQIQSGWLRWLDLFKRPRFAFGVLAIFVYVGAEVAIGSLLVNYLTQADVMSLDIESAGKHVPFYWGGAMVGRFIGAWLLRRFTPGCVLAGAATGVLAMLAISILSHGPISGWSLLAVGLFNSIMFPTIFSLAIEGLGERAPDGSGVICMAIVGGAVIPPVTGAVADAAGLSLSLLVPAGCYVAILSFGLFCGLRNFSSGTQAQRAQRR